MQSQLIKTSAVGVDLPPIDVPVRTGMLMNRIANMSQPFDLRNANLLHGFQTLLQEKDNAVFSLPTIIPDV